MKLGEAVASQLSHLLSAYTQQVQETLQAYLGQFAEQWQSALQVYVGQFNEQWQEAVQAAAGQRAPDLDAQLAASARPLQELSEALLSTLHAAVEQVTQELNMTTRLHQNATDADDSGEAE